MVFRSFKIHQSIILLLIINLLIIRVDSDCVYQVKPDLRPFWVDKSPEIVHGLTQCQ